MNNLNIIAYQIKYMLENGKKEICIYPFGIQGEDAKRILNIRFGIQEHAIVDRELCNYNKNVNINYENLQLKASKLNKD